MPAVAQSRQLDRFIGTCEVELHTNIAARERTGNSAVERHGRHGPTKFLYGLSLRIEPRQSSVSSEISRERIVLQISDLTHFTIVRGPWLTHANVN